MNATPTRPWTPEEENKLGELIIGAKSVEAIAKWLNRTPRAVRRRAVCLGYRCERSSLEANLQAKAKMTEPARPTSPPWNTADDELLRTLALKGVDARLIGMKLNRTAPAVRARANRLNLRLKKTILKRQMG